MDVDDKPLVNEMRIIFLLQSDGKWYKRRIFAHLFVLHWFMGNLSLAFQWRSDGILLEIGFNFIAKLLPLNIEIGGNHIVTMINGWIEQVSNLQDYSSNGNIANY